MNKGISVTGFVLGVVAVVLGAAAVVFGCIGLAGRKEIEF